MKFLTIFGYLLGFFGCLFGISAYFRLGKLEAELKRLKILAEKFDSDR